MKLFICPIEVVVQLEKTHLVCACKYVLCCVLIGATFLDKGLEKNFSFRCDAEIHHEVKLHVLHRVKFTDCIVHLILLRLRHDKFFACKSTSLVALLKVLVEELINDSALFALRCTPL